VQTGRRDRALVVPVAALRNGAGAAETARGTLWLAVDGHVQARAVTLGLRTLESVEVTEGLAAGDTVLLGDAPEPGARVKPRFDAPAAPRAAGDNGAGAMGAAMGR
jgi:HlyD family secretion protein